MSGANYYNLGYQGPTTNVSGVPSLYDKGKEIGKDILTAGQDLANDAATTLEANKAFAAGMAQQRKEDSFKTSYAGTLGKVNTFPSELISTNRPIIEFRCLQNHSILKEGTTIYLPAPEGLAYSNSSTYNDSELGIMGNAVLSGLNFKSGQSLEKIGSDLVGKAGAAWQAAKGVDLKTAILAGASELMPESFGPGVKSAVGIAAGARFNPYVVTSFDGTNTREYSFEYKLIPSSAEEAATIKRISQLFQIAVYGEVEGGFLLKYPPKWRLTILVPDDEARTGKPLKPLSSFHECYLQGCDVTYNASNNSYFRDNSPFETDISLTFKETKALHANEVAKLLIQ
jgi:hypothetical protein